ncbi:MAG TPA: PRC-barrel domain-containing protein [Nitrolancea sp.]|nr:PRC-barrel domain-containing protein [Nitrolancea sp.]
MKASELKGMTVVSLQEGAKLGQVDQPLFDLAKRQLWALHVKGDSGISVLPFDQIAKIGSDAITVTTSQVTQTPGADSVGEGLVDLHGLQKLKIVDQDGTFLGTLSEIEFDQLSGKVTQLLAHKGGMMGIGGTTTTIDAAATLTVGVELLTVNANEVSALSASTEMGDIDRANSNPANTDAMSSNAPTVDEAQPTHAPLSPNDPSPDSVAELPRRY